MKKIILGIILSASFINAEAFIGFGGSVGLQQDKINNCRGALTGLAGYDFNEYIDTEVRYSHRFRTDLQTFEAFIKPKYKNFYGLLGYSYSTFDEDPLVEFYNVYDGIYEGVSYGGGYTFKGNLFNINTDITFIGTDTINTKINSNFIYRF